MGSFCVDLNGTLLEYRGEKKSFSVVSSEDGNVISEITSYYKEMIRSVTVPGSTIKTIGFFAFKGCTAMEKIVLQPGVEKIELGAFWHCDNLKELWIPSSSLKYVHADAFPVDHKITVHVNYDCPGLWAQLKKANWRIRKVPRDIYEKHSGTLIGITLAYRKSINLVLHITGDLNNYEFNGFPVDCECVIEKDVYASNIFQCSAISRVQISKDVKFLHPDALSAGGEYFEDTSLERISVDAENPYFYDIDGVLFEKHTNRLIRYPQLKFIDQNSYYVPESTACISAGAFHWCYGIENLYIPKHTTLEPNALCNLPKLDKVYRETGG